MMVEHGQLSGRAVFSPFGGEHIFFVGQRTAFEVVADIVQAVIVQAIGRQLRITVNHTHVLAQHGQLRHAVVVQIVTIDKQRVALLHTHIAKCFDRIYLLENQSTVTEHIHAVVLHPHGADEHLHIGTQLLVGLRLVGIQQVDTGFLLSQRIFFLLLYCFCLFGGISSFLLVLGTEQADAKQA